MFGENDGKQNADYDDAINEWQSPYSTLSASLTYKNQQKSWYTRREIGFFFQTITFIILISGRV